MFIRIETTSGVPISRQIADQIRFACASKALLPGDRMPSVRVLAGQLAVNQNTILHVYERLVMEGLLESRHGDGTYVAASLLSGKLQAAQRQLLQAEVRALARKAAAMGLSPHYLHQLLDEAAPPSPRPRTQKERP